jgi:hypothetical protein
MGATALTSRLCPVLPLPDAAVREAGNGVCDEPVNGLVNAKALPSHLVDN